MKTITHFLLGAVALTAFGCTLIPQNPSGPDAGPHGTRAYYIEVETSDPGIRIEAENDYIGRSPVQIKVFGDPDGTFHNFGASEFIIRALPDSTNQFPQTKIFRTGGWFAQEDRIPKRIYFDMNQKSSGYIERPPRY